MKKILIAFMLIGLTFAVQKQVHAQTMQLKPVTVTTTAYNNTVDTVDDAETHVTNGFRVTNWNIGVTAQVIVKKISGTVGGSLALYGSMDNSEWNLIGSATTPSNGSANYSFNTTVGWYYYRVSWAGTGTMSASFKTTFLPY